MKFISIIVALSLFASSTSFADSPFPKRKLSLPILEAPEPERKLGAVISPMARGNKAPFTGVLLSPQAVAEIIAEFSAFEELLKIELEKLNEQNEAELERKLKNLNIEHEADKKILLVQLETRDKEVLNLGKQLQEEIDNRPNVFLWTSLGVLGGIGVTLLTTFLMHTSN